MATTNRDLRLVQKLGQVDSLSKCATQREARGPHVRTVETFTPSAAMLPRSSSTCGLALPKLFDLSSANVAARDHYLPTLHIWTTKHVRYASNSRCALLIGHPPLFINCATGRRDQDSTGYVWELTLWQDIWPEHHRSTRRWLRKFIRRAHDEDVLMCLIGKQHHLNSDWNSIVPWGSLACGVEHTSLARHARCRVDHSQTAHTDAIAKPC